MTNEPKKSDPLSATQYGKRVAEVVKEELSTVTPRPSNGRASVILAITNTAARFGENLVHVLVGLIFIGGGIWLIAWTVQHPPINKMLLYGGGGAALFGALLMPTILPIVKQIIVVVQAFPVVGAMIGGRRATDPPRAIDEPPPEKKP